MKILAGGKILEVWEEAGDQRDVWKQMPGDAQGLWSAMPKLITEEWLSMNQHDFLLELPTESKHGKCSAEGVRVGESVG